MVKFDVTLDDAELIRSIALRAYGIATRKAGGVREGMPKLQDWMMDITAVHANGCRLRLDELLKADDFNFTHDVFGIHQYLDRQTGVLGRCFVPRFAEAR